VPPPLKRKEIFRLNGEKLKELIESKGMTQKEFAQRIGVTPAAVCAIIAEKQTPSLALAALMARTLQVPLDELLNYPSVS